MAYISLTAKSQELLAAVIRPGDLVVDATVGNGHDTVFLADTVGDTGKVLGFDVQPQAIENTHRRLEQHHLQHRVTLLLHSHAQVNDCLPQERRIRAAMFNLGYLPGADRSVVTRAPSTMAALSYLSMRLLPGGLISIVAYRGHPGGEEEAAAVLAWGSRLDPASYTLQRFDTEAASERTPLLMIIKRL